MWGKRQKPTSSNPSSLTSTAQISISASLNHREREREKEQTDRQSEKTALPASFCFQSFPNYQLLEIGLNCSLGEMKWVYLGSLRDKGGRWKSNTNTLCVSLSLSHTHIVTLCKTKTHMYAQTHRLRASALSLCALWGYYGLPSETKSLVLF